MSDDVQVDKLVEKYIALRDFKAKVANEYKEKEAKIVEAMDDIERKLLSFLVKTGQESANTKAGSFYKRVTTTAKVADRDIFLRFVVDTDNLQFLESRVNKTAVEQYIAEHGTVPPGVDVVRAVAISVNRPKTL